MPALQGQLRLFFKQFIIYKTHEPPPPPHGPHVDLRLVNIFFSEFAEILSQQMAFSGHLGNPQSVFTLYIKVATL